MDVKKAIEFLEFLKKVDFTNSGKSYDMNDHIDSIIELLQRGLKHEYIFSDMHYAIQHMLDKIYLYNIKTPEMTDAEYIEKAFSIIEQEYFTEIIKSEEKK